MSIFLLSNVNLKFNDKAVLSDINLQIDNAGLVVVLGKSGSGKSSLLNILYGIQKPTEGTVIYSNKDIFKYNDRKFSLYHSYDISFVFQHYNLFDSFSSLDNVILPLLIRGEDKKKALEKAHQLFKKFNLEYIEKQLVGTLSGGEKQRVAILRSLIISPKVILSDEPTGALDSQNSVLVMEMFKEISKTTCVLLVSHEKELVEKYADRIIELKDGKIVLDKKIHKCSASLSLRRNKAKKGKSWSKKFIAHYYKENRLKNFFASISIVFGFLATFISFGFSNGSTKSQSEALKNNYSVQYATISLKNYYEIENSPLSYEKNVRPTIEEIDENILDNDYLIFAPNLNYAFALCPNAYFKNESLSNFMMIPLYSDEFTLLEEVIINQEMCNLLSLSKTEAIGQHINVSNFTSFSIASGDVNNPIIKDNISYEIDFVIKDVVQEFSFLNTPKIYYSYPKLCDYLNGIILNNISKSKKRHISVYKMVEEANGDDTISSYSMNVFLKNEDDSDKFFSLIKELKDNDELLQIESTAYEIKESYITFMNSFSSALFIFVLIAYLGVNFIIGILSLSSFIQKKKESAILTCLGARNSEIISIYFKLNSITLLISFFISLLLIFPLQLLLNTLIAKSFNLNNLIDVPFLKYQGFYFGLPIAIFVISFVISTLFVLIPILFYRHISITDELRDE